MASKRSPTGSDLAEQVVLWATIGLGTTFVVLCWPVMFDNQTFESVTAGGQLLLISLGQFTSALGYLAMANTRGWLRVVKSAVMGGGLILLLATFGAYLKAVSGRTAAAVAPVRPASVAGPSLRLFASCAAVGALSIFVRHRSDQVGDR